MSIFNPSEWSDEHCSS